MNNSKPPPAPDPNMVAAAQTASNKATATTQQQLNMVNQSGPQGSLTYSQNGTWADGTPKYTATSALSPTEQGIYDSNAAARGSMANTASALAGNLSGTLSQPVNLSNDAVEGRLFELGNKRLDPQFARDWDARETALMNRGILPGSEAYAREQDAFNRSKNDAYDQLALTGRSQAVNEILGGRNQSINELAALLSGGQVSNPNWINTPSAGVANTDVAGIYNNNYQNQLASYNASKSTQNAILGGLFGLGGTALGGWASGGFKGFK